MPLCFLSVNYIFRFFAESCDSQQEISYLLSNLVVFFKLKDIVFINLSFSYDIM